MGGWFGAGEGTGEEGEVEEGLTGGRAEEVVEGFPAVEKLFLGLVGGWIGG